MIPPYQVTAPILHFIADISEKIGALKAIQLAKPSPELRKKNRIKTIHSTLAIEGNSMTVEQISAIIDNKRVAGPPKDVAEVRNAIAVYEKMGQFNAASIADFLKAHQILMKNLLDDGGGKFRAAAVGIMKGELPAHLPPPPDLVPGQMAALFDWLKTSPEHPLVKSCVFHYETEFIHPFMDGNGRMGRLWQSVVLMEKYPVFEFLPVETIVRERQQAYYDVLAACDRAGNSTAFIAFMLEILDTALGELIEQAVHGFEVLARVEIFRKTIGPATFSRKDYLAHFKKLSTATASRDLKKAKDSGVLLATGEGNQVLYRFG